MVNRNTEARGISYERLSTCGHMLMHDLTGCPKTHASYCGC